MLSGKVMIIHIIADKRHSIKMSQYFPKPYEHYSGNVKIELDLSNCATKAELKGETGVDRFNLAAKLDLAHLTAEIDEIDVEKLQTVPVDLCKPINAVGIDLVKKLCMIN